MAKDHPISPPPDHLSTCGFHEHVNKVRDYRCTKFDIFWVRDGGDRPGIALLLQDWADCITGAGIVFCRGGACMRKQASADLCAGQGLAGGTQPDVTAWGKSAGARGRGRRRRGVYRGKQYDPGGYSPPGWSPGDGRGAATGRGRASRRYVRLGVARVRILDDSIVLYTRFARLLGQWILIHMRVYFSKPETSFTIVTTLQQR